jgi:hypothetical protein
MIFLLIRLRGGFGIGTSSPNAKLEINGKFVASDDGFSILSASHHNAVFSYTQSTTAYGADQNNGLTITVSPDATDWIESSHISQGLLVNALTKSTLGANTLDRQVSAQIQFGTNVDSPSGGTITNSYGLRLWPYQRGDTNITNMYDLFIGGGYLDGTGTITNHYGIYQESTGVINYLAGDVGIDTISPTARLQIGNATAAATLSDTYLSLGGEYSATAGTNPKIKIFDDGTSWLGFGVSGGQLDYLVRSTDDHVFYTGSNERMRIDGSLGNIGIGTSSPNYPLHLYGTTNGGADIYSQTDGGRSIKHWFRNAGRIWSIGQIGTTSSPSYAFNITDETASESRLSIDIFGNVGIGINNPSQKLHINGNFRLTGAYYDTVNSPGTSGQVLSSTATGTNWVDASTIGTTTFLGLTDTPSSYSEGSVFFASATDVSENNTMFFWDNTNQRLGIGTDTPLRRLHVVGSSQLQGEDGGYPIHSISSYGDENWEGSFIGLNRARGTSASPTVVFDGDSIGYVDMWGYDGDSYERAARISTLVDGSVSDGIVPTSIALSTTDLSGNLNTRLFIANSGNIGIGTTSPNYKLQVDGDIVPETDDTYTLGTSALRWQDLYLGPNSLHIGTDGDEGVISYDTTNDVFTFNKAAVFGTTVNNITGAIRWSVQTLRDMMGQSGSH